MTDDGLRSGAASRAELERALTQPSVVRPDDAAGLREPGERPADDVEDAAHDRSPARHRALERRRRARADAGPPVLGRQRRDRALDEDRRPRLVRVRRSAVEQLPRRRGRRDARHGGRDHRAASRRSAQGAPAPTPTPISHTQRPQPTPAPTPTPSPSPTPPAGRMHQQRRAGHPSAGEHSLGRARIPRVVVRTERVSDAVPRRDIDRGRRVRATAARSDGSPVAWARSRISGRGVPEPGQDKATPLGGDGMLGSPATGWPRYNRIAVQPVAVRRAWPGRVVPVHDPGAHPHPASIASTCGRSSRARSGWRTSACSGW